ncbi:hypothetical protein ACHAW6_000006 [Cyclotella cf. meneghiniana]
MWQISLPWQCSQQYNNHSH